MTPELSVQNFFRPSNVRITSISSTATDLVVTYSVSHPFSGPSDLNAPATAANRADLGITARALFLLDVPTATGNTYFTDVVANTSLLRNMDGYMQPRGLVPDASGLTANTFPFKLVVDEALGTNGNRSTASNGGLPEGNYRPADGWQGGNIGASRADWTGYDYLHQGQEASNSFTINKAALSGSSLTVDLAIVAKYTDPRGGATGAEKRANRLPSNPASLANFVYRLPYAALDVGKASYRGETGGLLPDNQVSASTVRFTVRDWDALATVTGRPDVSEDTDPTTVEPGGPGAPTVDVEIPGITTSPVTLALNDDDTVIGGDLTPESGASNDPLYYEGAVVNLAGVGGGQIAGDYVGLARFTDISDAQDRSTYEFPLDPDLTLITNGADRPSLQIFQRFVVNLGGVANDPPVATVSLAGGPTPVVASLGNLDFLLSAESDTEGDPVLYDIDVAFSGSFVPDITGLDPVAVPPPTFTMYTGTAPVNAGVTNLPVQAYVRYYDAAHAGSPTQIILDYEVAPAGANVPPTAVVDLTGGPNPTISSGGTLEFVLQSEFDSDSDPISYEIMYDYQGTFTADFGPTDPAGTPPLSLHTSTPLTNPGPGPVNRTARVHYYDPLRAGTPLFLDLPYTIADPSCGIVNETYDFTAGLQGWQLGQFGLPNADVDGWGHWNAGCTNTAAETASGGGLVGGYLNCAADPPPFSACSYLYDYGALPNYNIVSPFLTVPALCGANQVGIVFDGAMNANTTASLQVYTSIDDGCSWDAQGAPITATGAAQNLTGTTRVFTGVSGGDNLLVRIQFVDSDPFGYSDVTTNFAGAWLDNIRITATSGGTWSAGTPPTPPTTYYTDDFEGANNWTTYGLPQTDAAIADGGACGFPGPWGGWGACDANTGSVTGTAMTVGSDAGVCDTYEFDMAHTSDFNIVSPLIDLSSASATSVLEWDEVLDCDQAPWTTTVYMAINPTMGDPSAWGAPIKTYAHTAAENRGSTRLSAAVPAALIGQNNVRIRVQVTTPPATPTPDICNSSDGYTVSATVIGFDNIAVQEPTCP